MESRTISFDVMLFLFLVDSLACRTEYWYINNQYLLTAFDICLTQNISLGVECRGIAQTCSVFAMPACANTVCDKHGCSDSSRESTGRIPSPVIGRVEYQLWMKVLSPFNTTWR